MTGWLSDFSYRVALSPTLFAVSGVASLVLALAAVGYQAIRGAMSNPVDVLRSE